MPKKKKQSAKDKFGKLQVFPIELSPYRQECIVVVNGTMGDAVKYLKKLKTKPADLLASELMEFDDWETAKNSVGGACCYIDLKHGYVMIFEHEQNWKETLANVTHECIHLTNAVLHRAGMKLTRESEEAYTYLHTQAFTDIAHKIY